MDKRLKIILVAIMVPILIYFWPSSLGGDTEFLMVQGDSMLPAIEAGSFVVTKKAPSYEIDDIVSFPSTTAGITTIVVHRIIAEDENGFTIQGDNNAKPDRGYHSDEDILGKVIFATPYIGDLLGLARNPLVLIISATAVSLLQMAHKRSQKKKEKLRRIRLGLPKPDPILEEENKKPKKPDYSLFYGALGFSIFIFVLHQLSIGFQIGLKGDLLTGFLFEALEVSFASTVSFGFYLVMILGLYFMAKHYERKFLKKKVKSTKSKSVTQLLIGKDTIPALGIAQFGWIMYILLALFTLMEIGPPVLRQLTCDPSLDLDCAEWIG